ncbi:hypothetical protein [Dinoroseobacter shibae]|uniref:hypothetical protein n=1 Tax=Dinoroseobacter shibae TaxID=215813 RepID=UPI001389D313|nr:hypothetical protein [Dinoroseobacter shibae]URF45584.1 hypothetical protein M8008_12445 [Dinoroseobacter shibae]URF49889.1 hypothetical protein M8007_12445 [Dinoroseobacter shibae]
MAHRRAARADGVAEGREIGQLRLVGEAQRDPVLRPGRAAAEGRAGPGLAAQGLFQQPVEEPVFPGG